MKSGRKGGGKPHAHKGQRRRHVVVLEPGWQGIFATCVRGKESSARRELVEWISDLVDQKWPQESEQSPEQTQPDNGIEDSIAKEIAELSSDKSRLRIQPCDLGCDCLIFVKLRWPINPTELAIAAAQKALNSGTTIRYTLRLTPVKLVSAKLDSLSQLEDIISHAFEGGPWKFAVYPTIRNNNQILRDDLIRATAQLVGRTEGDHKVDLKNWDKLILVEVFQSVMGLSVVGGDYEELSRLNLRLLCEKGALNSVEAE